MAIATKDKAKYDKQLEELRQHIYPPYTDGVKAILKAKSMEVDNATIYNVVKGLKKDWTILKAIRAHFGLVDPDEEIPAKTLIKRQKLNAPQN